MEYVYVYSVWYSAHHVPFIKYINLLRGFGSVYVDNWKSVFRFVKYPQDFNSVLWHASICCQIGSKKSFENHERWKNRYVGEG